MKADRIDTRNEPAYGPAEAARYLRLPAATLRTWLIGRDYPKGEARAKFHPLIKPAGKQPLLLSFYNLIEAHVLRALRTEHGVAIAELRKAIAFAEKKLDVQRLLLSKELRTHAGDVFLDRYVELINLSASGQLVGISASRNSSYVPGFSRRTLTVHIISTLPPRASIR